MTTYTALTTLKGRKAAETLGAALEELQPEPTGVGVFEVEDDSGLWEVGGYFTDAPDAVALDLLAAAFGGNSRPSRLGGSLSMAPTMWTRSLRGQSLC
jgi:ribosomal protein L11 methyltransferase